MRLYAMLVMALSFGLLGSGTAQAQLGPGDKAPPIVTAKWFKGTPVTEFENGKVYVVEFWATWCGPCRVSIPHLTELAHQYRGKVAFAGISVWERDDAYLDKVDAFVKEMGDKMDYSVAADDKAGTMAQTWMTAAGERGIPSAFIVDQHGKIAWIGHPMSDLGPTLDKVLAGTWDVAAYQKKRTREQAEEAAQQRLNTQLSTLMQQKKYREALKVLDAEIARDKTKEELYATGRFAILAYVDEARAQTYAADIARRLYAKDPARLNQLAWMVIMPNGQLKKPNYKIGLQIAQLAATASKNNDPDVLDTLALAQYRNGQKAVAIKTQTRALALARKRGTPAQSLTEMEQRLKQFRSGK